MTKRNKINLRSIYKILLSISIFLAGICLITGCIYIYVSGDGYSRQIVSNTFSKINIPIYLCLLLIIGDIIWELLSPTRNKKQKIINNKSDDNIPSQSSKNVKIIRLVILSSAIVILIFGFVTGGYADVLTKAINICTECIGLG